MKMITIGDKEIKRLEYNGQPVVTMKMIAELHGLDYNTPAVAYSRNRDRFIEGTDVLFLTYRKASEMGIKAPAGCNFFTESGYLKLVKTFGDDLAWQIQSQLIEGYFHLKAISTQAIPQQTSNIPSASPLALAELMLSELKSQSARVEQLENRVEVVEQIESRIDAYEEAMKLTQDHKCQLQELKVVVVGRWLRTYPKLNTQKAYRGFFDRGNKFVRANSYHEIPAKMSDVVYDYLKNLQPTAIFNAKELMLASQTGQLDLGV